MATMKPNLPEDLMKKIDRLGKETDRICEKALTEGGQVMKKSVADHLSQVVGKDIIASITTAKLWIFFVNSQSKFHSRNGVEFTLRNQRK